MAVNFGEVTKSGLRGCGSSTWMICLIVPGRGEHGDAVGQEGGLAQAVGDEDDGLVGPGQQHREVLAEDHPGLLVERAERLVHQQNAGLEAERAGQGRALAHAAGELAGIVLREVLEPDGFERSVRAPRVRRGTPWNTMPRLTFSNTVFHGNRAFSWNTKAMSRGIGPATFWSKTSTVPVVGAISPPTTLSKVDLPQPLGPMVQSAARDVERGVAQRPHVAGVAFLAEVMRDILSDRDGASGLAPGSSCASWPAHHLVRKRAGLPARVVIGSIPQCLGEGFGIELAHVRLFRQRLHLHE